MNESSQQLPEPWPPPLDIALTVLPAVKCPYLPGRFETARALRAREVDPMIYQAFMDCGFRRSGLIIYQPACAGCRECVPIRVPVDRFAASKSQRRVARRNSDLVLSVDSPRLTPEKVRLYEAYLTHWHNRPGEASEASLREFLYESPVNTLEFEYRDAVGKLVGVGICDVNAFALSSVYFYFDPAERGRSPGVCSVLREIEWAKSLGIRYYYLGYYVRECAAMNYKADYRPCELLGPDGSWRALADEG